MPAQDDPKTKLPLAPDANEIFNRIALGMTKHQRLLSTRRHHQQDDNDLNPAYAHPPTQGSATPLALPFLKIISSIRVVISPAARQRHADAAEEGAGRNAARQLAEREMMNNRKRRGGAGGGGGGAEREKVEDGDVVMGEAGVEAEGQMDEQEQTGAEKAKKRKNKNKNKKKKKKGPDGKVNAETNGEAEVEVDED
ncbi:hypothetical protein NEMBOFW57_009792 [Staphylotrichum longicolle]|uniref:Uncharacterized protein n=1 Tax=Staphylotrichum longicolle TaxID=669026 RepID=A0AAD4EPY7_9PEZI|nr:hypothetical protein NEMBOFW57_009792 [Staphylotrichum longicolle]